MSRADGTGRLALFDCDGTLVDSQANICGAMEQAFETAGISPPPRNDTRRIVGLSLVEAMRLLLPEANDERHRELVQLYKDAFIAMRGNGLVEEPLYHGMEELLRDLHADAWHLGVATGKSDRGLHKCLDHHGIKDMFVTLQTADRHPSKPHPAMVVQAMNDAGVAPSGTTMIGDTSFDMEMGRAAGCRTIGVSWGYHPVDELRQYGAEIIVESMEELKATLEEIS